MTKNKLHCNQISYLGRISFLGRSMWDTNHFVSSCNKFPFGVLRSTNRGSSSWISVHHSLVNNLTTGSNIGISRNEFPFAVFRSIHRGSSRSVYNGSVNHLTSRLNFGISCNSNCSKYKNSF